MPAMPGQGLDDLRNTLGEAARIARHRWRRALVALNLVAAAALWGSQYLPRRYTASTLFERRDDPVLQNLVQSNSPYSFEHLKTTMALDMTGSRALATALEQAGLVPAGTFTSTAALNERERAVLDAAVARHRIRPSLRLLQSTPSLDTIELRCDAADPDVARRLTVLLRDGYIAQTRERIREILGGTREFFAAEADRLQSRLAETDERLQEGLEDFPGLDPTDPVGLGNRLELLRAQRDTLFQRQAALAADVEAREAFLAGAPPVYATDAAAAATQQELYPPTTATSYVDQALDRAIEKVQQQIVDLVTANRMTLEHPDVKAQYARLQALQNLRTALATSEPPETEGDGGVAGEGAAPEPGRSPAVPPAVSDAYRQWQAQQMRVELELDALHRQHETAAGQYAEAQARLERFEALYTQFRSQDDGIRRLTHERQEAIAELSVWQGHLARLERILAAESGARGTQFALLEEPNEGAPPTQPRLASIFVVSSGLGLAAAVLLVVLSELLDRSFRSPGQVSRVLGVPVLECIGVIPTPRERRRARLARLVWVPTLSGLLLTLTVSAVLAYASLAAPALHHRAVERLGGALQKAGLAELAPPPAPL